MITFGTAHPTFSGHRPITRQADSSLPATPQFSGKKEDTVVNNKRRDEVGAALLALGALGTLIGGANILNGISSPTYTGTGQAISQALGDETQALHLSPEARKTATPIFLNTLQTLGLEATAEASNQADSDGLRRIFNKALKQVRPQLTQAQAAELDKTVKARQEVLDELLKEAAAIQTNADVEKFYTDAIDKLFTDQELPPDDKKSLKTLGVQFLQSCQQNRDDNMRSGIAIGMPSLLIALSGYALMRSSEKRKAATSDPGDIPSFDKMA